MKILAIVFTSRRKDRPASLQVTEEICRLASEHGGGDAEIEIVTMSELPVLACAGCKTCFREGRCPADKADGMAELLWTAVRAGVMSSNCWGSPAWCSALPPQPAAIGRRIIWQSVWRSWAPWFRPNRRFKSWERAC